MQILAYSNNKFTWKWFTSEWLRQGEPFLLMNIYPLFDNATKLLVNLGFIFAMTTWTDKSWRLSYIALVFFRPFDQLYIFISDFHFLTSLILDLTSFSWYLRASSPSFPETVIFTPEGWRKFRWLPFPPLLEKPAFSSIEINSRIFLGIRMMILF